MSGIPDWLANNWRDVAVPLAVFGVSLIAMFWLRRRAKEPLVRWSRRTKWSADDLLVPALDTPSIIWCIILSAYLALMVSILPAEWKLPAGRVLWSLFLVSITLSIANIINGFIAFYGPRINIPGATLRLIRSIARITVFTVGFLILLDIWGVPTTPLLLLIIVGAIAAALASRDALPGLFAGLQLMATEQIKPGDYIKLESGEEGLVAGISWRNTRIETLDQKTIIVPNTRLVQRTVINYGRPLKKAGSPFRFVSRIYLPELTGLKARTLKELNDILKQAPDAVVFYHIHHFLEEQNQLQPELTNDFAVWVSDALGEEVLGERMAAIDTFSFATVGALRERLSGVIEEYLCGHPAAREAMDGRSFHFMKAVSLLFPTPYVVHDLRQFVEALRKVSPESLYLHMYEARLRHGQGRNDFSTWLEKDLQDRDLSEEIARLDPYAYTLEGLRSALIQLVEKRIK